MLLIIVTGTAAFGLGRLSRDPPTAQPVVLERAFEVPERALSAVALESQEDEVPLSASTTGAYVASKNGEVYHLPWCSGAKRISEKNKVWFESKEEAEAAGYRKAGNCKGL